MPRFATPFSELNIEEFICYGGLFICFFGRSMIVNKGSWIFGGKLFMSLCCVKLLLKASLQMSSS